MRHVKIPTQWTGEDALTVVSFLEDVLQAVWRQHRKKIGEELSRQHAAFRSEPPSSLRDEPDADPFPF